MDIFYILLTLIPIIFPFIFLVVLNLPAKIGMGLTYLIIFISCLLFWGMDIPTLLAISLEGVTKAITILLILYGAVLLLNVLRKNGSIDRMNVGFKSISEDMRVQLILLGFVFAALLEGISGFGAPVAVVGALLITLGFPALPTAIALVIGNTIPAEFGAVGTPILAGMSDLFNGSIASLDLQILTNSIIRIDFLMGIFIPFSMVISFILFSNSKNKKTAIMEIVPFSLFVGIFYMTTALFFSTILGPELISIITPIISLIVVSFTIKIGLFIPKNVFTELIEVENQHEIQSDKNIFIAWLPYLSVIIILLATRLIAPLKETLSHIAIDLFGFATNFLIGPNDLKTYLDILYSPGSILIIIAIITLLLSKSTLKDHKEVHINTSSLVLKTAIAMIPTLAMVQIFIRSGSTYNTIGLISMPEMLANTLSNVGNYWVFLATPLGELGAFISGSSTTSNMTFSVIQYNIANTIGINPYYLLGAQSAGAGLGHIISINVILSACAVTGLSGKEGEVLKRGSLAALFLTLLAIISLLINIVIF